MPAEHRHTFRLTQPLLFSKLKTGGYVEPIKVNVLSQMNL